MRQSSLNIALVGAGAWMEKYHIPAIMSLSEKRNLRIRGIWNRTREKAEACAGTYGIPRVYENLEELTQDSETDCRVVVVSKTALAETLRILARRAVPLISEKPPGATGAEARELAKLVRVPNVVAFNRRYAPLNLKLHTLLREELQPPHFVECSFSRRGRNDKNFITESGIHGINYLEFLFGPIRRAETDAYEIPGTDVQNRVVSVEFASGVRGIIKFFPFSGAAVERYEIQGLNYTAYLHTAQHYTDEPESSLTLYRQTGIGKLEITRYGDEDADPLVRAGFLGEYEDFFQAVRDSKHVTLSNFTNAWHSQVLAESIEKGIPYRD